MEIIHTDTNEDRRGRELYIKMLKSPNWHIVKTKEVRREHATSFTIGFDAILQKMSNKTKYIFMKMRETNEGKTHTYTFKEQYTENYNAPNSNN